MTVIAWDGLTLAADKQSTVYGYANRVTKLFRCDVGIVALLGYGQHANQLLQWLRKEGPDEFPKPTSAEDVGTALVISYENKILCFSLGPTPVVYEDKFIAMGAGRDYALAAMHLGYSAEVAVKVACELDVNCGLGIDTLTLKE